MRLFHPLLLLVFITGCATGPITSTCPVDMPLLIDLRLPAKPTGPATNGDLLDYALDMNEQVAADSARKAELRRQLEQCNK